ncbi:O-Antigen ligase [Rosistilla oblonga]|uniref:O-antigen ligase family protein n=1 Tax=Rosistilla oblonga TaxID=2527990 RepID=UPI001187CEB9|nr:O-antigen ligase family protein [Rosistilla oblonga]QDV11311.1 O-Antigen ligase [Rosistilla oblonga]
MTSTTLGAIYCVLSAGLFVYAIQSATCALRSFAYAVILNTLPLVAFGYLGNNEETRVAGVPIAYIPFCASVLGIAFRTDWIDFRVGRLDVVGAALLAFMLLQAVFLQSRFFGFLPYYLMWILNFATLHMTTRVVSGLSREQVSRIVHHFVISLAICCLVGIVKYFTGIARDANFMPMMNRNGTAFVIAICTPLILFLREQRLITISRVVVLYAVYAICIVFTFSRMGIIGFVFSTGFYFIASFLADFVSGNSSRSASSNRYAIVVMCLFVSLLMLTPLAETTRGRFITTVHTISRVMEHAEVDSRLADSKRRRLLDQGMDVVRTHFWFGTGVGVECYQGALADLGCVELVKPHNFYLSYLGELGIVGFSILIVYLGLLYRQLSAGADSGIAMLSFRSMFLAAILMFTMNEHVTMPLLWFLWGIAVGFGRVRHAARAHVQRDAGSIFNGSGVCVLSVLPKQRGVL